MKQVADAVALQPKLLAEARPTNDTALRQALDEAAKNPELAPLVRVVETLPTPA
jgi:hypothetical protein